MNEPCLLPLRDRQALALEEVLGRIVPRILTLMNAACIPGDRTARLEEMRKTHERAEELAPLFATEPGIRGDILTIGQIGGAAVSLAPQVPMQLFEKLTETADALDRILAERQASRQSVQAAAGDAAGTLRPEAPPVLRYAKWVLLYGRRHWKIIAIVIVAAVIISVAKRYI